MPRRFEPLPQPPHRRLGRRIRRRIRGVGAEEAEAAVAEALGAAQDLRFGAGPWGLGGPSGNRPVESPWGALSVAVGIPFFFFLGGVGGPGVRWKSPWEEQVQKRVEVAISCFVLDWGVQRRFMGKRFGFGLEVEGPVEVHVKKAWRLIWPSFGVAFLLVGLALCLFNSF